MLGREASSVAVSKLAAMIEAPKKLINLFILFSFSNIFDKKPMSNQILFD